MDENLGNAVNQTFPLPERRIMKMIALRGVVPFPHQSMHFDLGRDKSLIALNKAIEEDQLIFLAAQKRQGVINPGPKDIYRVGAVCRIKQVIKLTNDSVRIIISVLERQEIESYVSILPYFEVALKDIEPRLYDEVEFEATRRKMGELFGEYLKLEHKLPPEALALLTAEEPERFVYGIAAYIFHKDTERQKLLEERSLLAQMESVCFALCAESEIMLTQRKISVKVRKAIDKNQKDYYLREQVKAINEELGEGQDEAKELLEKAKTLKLPQEAAERVEREVRRMQKMSSTTPEAAVVRTYLDWICDMPWNKLTKDNADLVKAQKILNDDHFGLEKVKERIIEYLAVYRLTKALKGPILCFVGPPGVGKTSIVRSIAKALNKKFVSVSLGGVRDEAEIRGHRRTYIGAIPGRIISQIKLADCNNPVFLLDEIDKMSGDYRGDPASAMLEVLDPEQNYAFRDHYLDLPYDLSKVMFITTANTTDTIPAPLLDRMEIIELSGYTHEEKLEIAKRYLIKKQCEANGVKEKFISISDGAVEKLIADYTRESGVRNLEREIANVIRKIAVKIVNARDGANAAGAANVAGAAANGALSAESAESGTGADGEANAESAANAGNLVNAVNGKSAENANGTTADTAGDGVFKDGVYSITAENLEEFAGVQKFIPQTAGGADEVGVATGLAWTAVGGKTLEIEVSVIEDGKGDIQLTGSLGDVMKESARTALSLIRSRAAKYGVALENFTKRDLHVHIPAGATPKDGPSAGITMATAILSAMSGKPVSKDVAMTGEVTLRGKVLAIGGLKEKALAAFRVGIRKLIVPLENKKDMHEIPENVRNLFDVTYADNIDTVFQAALA